MKNWSKIYFFPRWFSCHFDGNKLQKEKYWPEGEVWRCDNGNVRGVGKGKCERNKQEANVPWRRKHGWINRLHNWGEICGRKSAFSYDQMTQKGWPQLVKLRSPPVYLLPSKMHVATMARAWITLKKKQNIQQELTTTHQCRWRNECRPSLSVISAAFIALGRSCLLAKTNNTASLSSSYNQNYPLAIINTRN